MTTTLVQKLAEQLKQRDWKLVLAESCTGGLIAAACTEVAGSSVWFERGYVTYSNDAKTECLHVPENVLERHGAVSEATVIAMSQGALKYSHGDIALAVSGIAGPDGGNADKPLGTVWFAISTFSGLSKAKKEQFQGDRYQVREQAVRCALEWLIEHSQAA